ncbi:disease resistance protein RPV1-like isoform X2 [Trifolium pratense]|uniref:disease resistance protein RPV1-like isoform X2 n=1 Tax=Trifolium pratense TaxID=57577 RepID=UPI001E695316|nr:disease resistance protein RPV1-like isoform X2 [Trifolium pratense]
MSLQSPSSSSSFPNEYFNYQAFLNFRGIDTRYGFTNNLYNALKDKGIHTFIDYNDLQRGDEITPTLIKAINESRIYIPIFSINYASSSFCLDELVHIMCGFKEKGRLVLPVFYGVDPSDVRHQKGSCGKALAEHEKKFQNNEKNMERLCRWKIALNQAANIAGYHFNIGSDMNEYEHTLIGKIVKVVSNKINRAPLYVVDYPVGLKSRVSNVNSLLNEACSDEVCMIGIHGTGGIGKSTLARAVYNFIADQFECLCFLENVRENSAKHLQEELLYKTIGLKVKIGGVNEGIGIIKERLRRKRVLLILDDVDKLKQLKFLAGGFDWFGRNSRVIITTRDKSLLTCHGIERIYEVEGLNCGESLELFKQVAFKTKKVDSINDDIVNRAISYASGLPLAIDVIGSNLAGTPIAEWESTLDKYKRIPPHDIQNILKVSFDGLDEEQKNLFLDIACFSKWFHLGQIRANYDHCIKHDVGVLVDKSLIKIHQFGDVILHDLIEHMGKEIVRKESPDHPEKRSRLWFHKDIVDVLEQNKGSSKTKMIYLDYPSKEVVINWNGEAFKKMTNLKTLVIKNANFSEGSRHFPNSLRVLEWEKYPSIPFSILNKKFENMKVLNFDNCEYLTEISNVSGLPNLEEISFENCVNLTTIDNSIGFLSKLELLNAEGCTKLRSFPPLKLPSLKYLNFTDCESLQNFPEILDKIETLENINIYGTSIQEIPVSIQNLIGLVSLNFDTSGKLMFPSICNMPKVEVVRLKGISNLSLFLPMAIMRFANMQVLNLSGSNIRVLPECLKECTSLHHLILDYCYSLEVISAIPPNLQRLSAIDCKSLSKSMLLNKKLHESGRTIEFCFPPAEGEMIPEWFNHQTRGTTDKSGTTFPFWFRNKLPSIMIFFSTNSKMEYLGESSSVLSFNLFINDFKRNFNDIQDKLFQHGWLPSHTYLFNLPMQQKIEIHDILLDSSQPKLMPTLDEAFEKNEWIHAEIKFWSTATLPLYFVEENNADHIRFTNPCRKRKLDELEHIYQDTSLSQSRPLLKNQRLLDVEEVLDTELVEKELQHGMNKLRHDTKSCEYEFGGNSPNKIKMDYLKLFKWARCAAPYISHSKSIIIVFLCVIMCVILFLFKEKTTMLSLGELTCPT